MVADIVDVARTLNAEPGQRVPYLSFQSSSLSSHPVLPIDDVETAYYLRMSALDKPGVLSRVAQILSDDGISIEALIQKEPADGANLVPMIILTNRTIEGKLSAAVSRIEGLEGIVGDVTRIRVESLAG